MKTTITTRFGELGIAPELAKTVHDKILSTYKLTPEEISYDNVLRALRHHFGTQIFDGCECNETEKQLRDFIANATNPSPVLLLEETGVAAALVLKNSANIYLHLKSCPIIDMLEDLKSLCIYDKAYTRVSVSVKGNTFELYLRGHAENAIEDVTKFINGEDNLAGLTMSRDISNLPILSNLFFVAALLGIESVVQIGDTVMFSEAGYSEQQNLPMSRTFSQDIQR